MELKGIYAPIPTPFHENRKIYPSALEKNLERWQRSELDGIVVCGSNGELPFLSLKERQELTRHCVQRAGNSLHIVTGVHFPSTQDTIECVRAVADAGSEAGLLLPPSYYKGQGMPGVIHYFETVADASPIPIILYNMPENTGVSLDTTTILHLAKHPNIIGIKDTSGNMTQMGFLCAHAPEGFSVFAGSANYFLPALSLGASGGTLAAANLYPASCKRLAELFFKGDNKAAADIQQRLLLISDTLTRRYGIPGLKAALDSRGLFGGPCRLPLMPIPGSIKAEICKILDQASLDTYETWRH